MLLANLSQFKIIKFPGFEAERWDETKVEAQELVTHLRDGLDRVNAQILETKIESSYIQGAKWSEKVEICREICSYHPNSGGNKNILAAKKKLDWAYKNELLFWASDQVSQQLHNQLSASAIKFDPSRSENASNHLATEENYRALLALRENCPRPAQRELIDQQAHTILDWLEAKERTLKNDFDLTIEIEKQVTRVLRRVADLPPTGQVTFEDDLIHLLDNER